MEHIKGIFKNVIHIVVYSHLFDLLNQTGLLMMSVHLQTVLNAGVNIRRKYS